MVSFNKYVEPDPEWARRYEDLFPLFLRMRGHLKEDLDELAEVSRRHALH